MRIPRQHGCRSGLLVRFDNTIAYTMKTRQVSDLGREQMRTKVRPANDTYEFRYRLETGKGLQGREKSGEGQIHEFSF